MKSPVVLTPVIEKLTAAWFLTVIALAAVTPPVAWEPKDIETADKYIGLTLLPESPTTACGMPAASSVMVKLPVNIPVAIGVNVTLILHDAPAASELPQVFV